MIRPGEPVSQRSEPAGVSSGFEAPGSGGSRAALIAVLMISAATVLVYSNTFDASFHLDDELNIINNQGVRDLRSLWPPSGTRLLGFLSFALNYRFGGVEVFGYHLVNVLIHLCNALLLYWLTASTLRTPLLRRAEQGSVLRRHLPLTAGLLFAVHPIQTQAVTYIVQRFTSLATLFFLLSLVLYARARLSLEADRPSAPRAAAFLGLSVLAAVAAMETKEIAFTLPLVAATYELVFFPSKRRMLLLAPLVATALLVPLGVMHGQKLGDVLTDAGRLTAETREIPRLVYLLTQLRVLVTYLRLLVLPVGQNLDYDFLLSRSLADPRVLFAIAVLLTVSACAVLLLVQARRANRAAGTLVFFGVAWFFLTSSVESSVIPIRDVIFEHRVYLPSAGAAFVLGTAVLSAVEALRLRTSVGLQCAASLLVTALPLGAAAHARNAVWKDEFTLWSDVVSKSPAKSRPHSNLGNAYRVNGRIDEAIREFRTAIRLEPGRAEAHNGLGISYVAKGQLDDAIREYREAIRLDPSLAEAYSNLGVVYDKQDRLDDAMREYRKALELEPGNAEAHNNVGVIYGAKGQIDDAIREYREALRLDPRLAGAHSNLAEIYEAMGQLDDAVREYREAIRLDPGNAEARRSLGDLLRRRSTLSGSEPNPR